MMSFQKWSISMMAAGLLAAVAGCGGQSDVGQVTGKVMLDGKPMTGAIINFQPKEGRAGMSNIAADGSYELNYTTGVKGTKIGSNTVFFTPATDTSKIPPKYMKPSDLIKEVKPGKQTFDFDLKSK